MHRKGKSIQWSLHSKNNERNNRTKRRALNCLKSRGKLKQFVTFQKMPLEMHSRILVKPRISTVEPTICTAQEWFINRWISTRLQQHYANTMFVCLIFDKRSTPRGKKYIVFSLTMGWTQRQTNVGWAWIENGVEDGNGGSLKITL